GWGRAGRGGGRRGWGRARGGWRRAALPCRRPPVRRARHPPLPEWAGDHKLAPTMGLIPWTTGGMSMSLRTGIIAAALALGAALSPSSASAQQITLRLHQFLPAAATIPKDFLAPWAKKVETDSKGRIRIELYPSLQLGGTPAQLYDQL